MSTAKNALQAKFLNPNRARPESAATLDSPSVKGALARFELAEAVAATASREGEKRRDSDPKQARDISSLIPPGVSAEYRQWCIANDYAPGESIEIPLGNMKEDRFNPRHFYPQKLLEPLITNLIQQKQKSPMHVRPDYENPGEFFIRDGGRRWRALKQINATHGWAIVVDVAPGLESYKLGWDLNTQRDSQTPFDNVIKWRQMLADGLFASQRELASALGVDETLVTTTMKLEALPEDVMNEMVISPKRFGTRLAWEIGRYYELTENDKEATVALIHRVADENLPLEKVREIIAKWRDRATPGRATSRSVFNQRITISLPGGGNAGTLKTYGTDRIKLDLKGLPQNTRDELQRAIEEVLKPLRDVQGSLDIKPEQTH